MGAERYASSCATRAAQEETLHFKGRATPTFGPEDAPFGRGSPGIALSSSCCNSCNISTRHSG
jgi:hypothetical protein